MGTAQGLIAARRYFCYGGFRTQKGQFIKGRGLLKGAILARLFALPVMTYNWLYQGSSANLLRLDYMNLLIGYSLVGAVLGFFRGKSDV